ncbi:MAG: PatB family C-S lyase [Muribaculaceae bacterium]|nr:PatB family C-S lyase [Muribaculaceae bacterium]MDE5972845.1 PatB family C-S lyase [Muribaculaceae bacterium]MDE6461202.1 PatB family C-S lyase [Muribaculaceae bacterium]MDE6508577.1 PatB family C-S lyase [Muribaculaceae bacterium]
MTQNSHFDFVTPVDRHYTGAIKYCRIPAMTGAESEDADLISLWIADMDFPTPDFIIDALRRRLDHPVLGYTDPPVELWPTVSRWIEGLHGWKTETEWFRFVPGIVKGIGFVINRFVKEDEKVIIQPPVYHPFRMVPEGNRRQVVFNPLKINAEGKYEMDFDHLAEVADEKCRLLILCNPHNPGGVLWDADTLRRLAKFCHDRGIIVISDEIHSDMALWGQRHIPFASVSPEAAECSVTFGSPSKTFNMAGVVSSYAIVPSARLRKELFEWMDANEFADPNIFSPIATIAAFTHGAEWRKEMLAQIERNVNFVSEYCAAEIPAIKPYHPEASFLVWLDCTALGLDHDRLQELFVKKAGLLLNDGEMFGPGGEGHMRLNVGAPASVMAEAMRRLKAAVDSL